AAGGVSRASAEIVFFTSGRTFSVQSHRIEGTSIVFVLRGGGEITCDRAEIARIEPDEMPLASPVPAAPAAAPAPSQAANGPVTAYDSIVRQIAARQGVDAGLVRAVIAVESGWQPEATSPKGAMGLMQLMPDTARQYNVQDPYDPRANIEAGVRHLKDLLGRYSLRLALAAYNAGEAAVARFGGVPPYPETEAYVARVLARARR
ncbi:MAG TPA: lytic transglycosylase domain-containing protein, partial [Vicinamibacterales bacterium]|nr:lytic transglycosylase domain-containing protein [Vicinamibacterales bacterium]